MDLNKAIQGFILTNTQLASRTSSLYNACLSFFSNYMKNPEVDEITIEDLNRFIIFLQTEYIPNRPNGDTSPLSGAAMDNYWKSIRSFFSWAEINLKINRPDRSWKRPKYAAAEVIPFTKEEIGKILYACKWTKEADTSGRKTFRMKRATADRDYAICLLLLDTGIRLGELCRLKIQDVNLESGEIHIKTYSTGVKSKPRTVFLGRTSKKAVWFYLSKLEDQYADDTLFGINHSTLQSIFFRLSERTGVHVHAHKFRHTFAIQYLRNGGDIFTLKRLLGHKTFKMVQYYLRLADTDAQDAHRRASPADRWKL